MVNKSGSLAPPAAVQQSAAAPVPLRKRRGRGRPSTENSEDVRKKLLDAAGELFPRYGYRGVSSRQIGAAAGGVLCFLGSGCPRGCGGVGHISLDSVGG